jgi:hypothetical protein
VAMHVTHVAIGHTGIGRAEGMLARAISCWVTSLPTAAGRATLHVMMQGNGADAGWSHRCRPDKEPVLAD